MRFLTMQLLPDNVSPELAKAAPGVIASLVALRWINGTPLQRMATFLGGASGSYYLTDWVAGMFGMAGHGGAMSWLVGLFSMALAHRVFATIDGLDMVQRINRLLERWGL